MTSKPIVHTDFGGIVKSINNPSPNTFKSLVNLRPDLRVQALVGRFGYESYERADNTQDVVSDGFCFNDFGDTNGKITIRNSNVYFGADIISDLDNGGGGTVGYRVNGELALTATLKTTINTITGGGAGMTLLSNNTPYFINGAIIRNTSKVPDQWAVAKTVAGPFGIGPFTFSIVFNKTVSWTAGDTIIIYRNDLQASVPDATADPLSLQLPYTVETRSQFLNVGGKNDVAIVGVIDQLQNKNIWVGRIANRGFFNNAFTFNGVYCTSLMNDFDYGPLSPSTHHIQLSTDNVSQSGVQGWYNTFQFSFSVKYDGFNESKLIYTGAPYGKVPTVISTYTDTNVVDFVDMQSGQTETSFGGRTDVSTAPTRGFGNSRSRNSAPVKVSGSPTRSGVSLKIIIPQADKINRRITSIVVYNRQIGVDRVRTGANENPISYYPWRWCFEVDINDSRWTYDAGTDSYFINLGVTSDMLNGPLYIDKVQADENDFFSRNVEYGTTMNGRLFARDIDNPQAIFYSPINDSGYAMSCLPTTSYFLLTKIQGDINGMISINDKLIVWKKSCTYSVNASGLPSGVVDEVVDANNGLASLASVARGDKVVYYNSYAGVYRTDGFKSQLINSAWIEDYLSYSQAQLESALGFFEPFTESYYLYVAGILWVFDSKVNQWHQEDLTHTIAGIVYGVPSYTARDIDSRTVIQGLNDGLCYKFPRTDLLYKDTPITLGADFSYQCTWETNNYEVPLENVLHINNGYVRGENVSGLTLSLNSGGVSIKSKSITNDGQIVPFRTLTPVSRYSLSGSISNNLLKVVIRQIGLLAKIANRVGTIKVAS